MKQKTFYHIILDQSGSMRSCLLPTIAGFNEQLQVIQSLQQRYPEQEIRVGLTCFNQSVMHAYSVQHPEMVTQLNEAIYKPNGSTALYDAIGLTIQRLQYEIGRELVREEAAVVVVIITDGYENASRSFHQSQISTTIKELESTGKWTFSYIGATVDAVKIATSLHIREQNSMHFHKESIKETFIKLGFSMDGYIKKRGGGERPTEFLNWED